MAEISRTKPEIIINQWAFVQRYKHPDGIFELVYQLGLRLYFATGSDEEKLAMLRQLAAWDYHLSMIFPIPDTRGVHLGLGGDPSVPTLKGVVPGQTVASPEKRMPLYREPLEACQQLLPEDPLTAEFKHTDLENLSLLYLFTPVEVDENGRMTAHASNPELVVNNPCLAVNTWAFPDTTSHLIQRLAGRAYLVAGDRGTVDAILANLSAADHLLANRIPLPASLPTTDMEGGVLGPINFTEVMAHEQAVYSLIRTQIQTEIPVLFGDCEKKRKYQYQLPAGPRICRASVVGTNLPAQTYVR